MALVLTLATLGSVLLCMQDVDAGSNATGPLSSIALHRSVWMASRSRNCPLVAIEGSTKSVWPICNVSCLTWNSWNFLVVLVLFLTQVWQFHKKSLHLTNCVFFADFSHSSFPLHFCQKQWNQNWFFADYPPWEADSKMVSYAAVGDLGAEKNADIAQI